MQAIARKVLLIFIPLIALAVPASAQVQVVDAGGSQSTAPAQAPANNSQNDILVNMYLQLEALQAEVQNLRGLVEEQSYQIRRMQTEQRDRYIDTDSRISELYNQVQGGQVVTSGQAPTSPAQPGTGEAPLTTRPVVSANNRGNPAQTTIASVTAPSTPQNESELYRSALDLLLEDSDFEQSIAMFQQYLDIYPQGRYLTNTLYWQGAAMELAGRHNQAIVVLQRVINEFTDDAKAPTAMLRLGTVYRKMGDNAQAAQFWRRISELYPNSNSEIELAREYLSEIGF